MPLRILIGAACVAIMAFVGYFFWQQYEESRRLNAAREDVRCEPILAAWEAVKRGGPNPTGRTKVDALLSASTCGVETNDENRRLAGAQ